MAIQSLTSSSIGVMDIAQKTRFYKSHFIKRSIKSLAEAIILQSVEDLWNPFHREESIQFFKSDEFRLCAEIAEMNKPDQWKMLWILERAGVKQILEVAKT